MKNKNKYIICGILLLVIIGVSVFLIINKKEKNNVDITSLSDDKILEMTKILLQEDQEIKNMIYGNVTIDEATLTFENISYNHYSGNLIKSSKSLHDLINKNYGTSMIKQLENDFGKYNEFVTEKKELYVKKNPKCEIMNFNKNVSIKERYDSFIVVYFGKYSCQIYIKDNKLVLMNTPYVCSNEITTEMTES